MFLNQRLNYFYPAAMTATTSTTVSALLGTTQKMPIDRTWPLEEIMVNLYFVIGTSMTPTVLSATTPDQYDNILTMAQTINLTVNDGKQPRAVINKTGVAILESAFHNGLNLDMATQALIAMSQITYPIATGTTATTGGGSFQSATASATNPVIPVGAYQLSYRIPMVEPAIGEPLRSRMYLPIHTYPQDPVLAITYQTGANLMAGGTYSSNITAIYTEIILVRRVVTAASEKLLQSTAGTNPNGYIDWDDIETTYAIPLGSSAQYRAALPIPGQYANLIMRQYRGGSPLNRNVIDTSGIGDNVTDGFGSETDWNIQTGQVIIRDWRWKHLRQMNELSRPTTVINSLVTPSSGTTGSNVNYGLLGGPLIPSTNFRAASSTKLDFLGDGLTGDSGIELGSLLDCNTPANNGLKMEIVGMPASVSTNSSYLFVNGRRYFGDLTRWQKFS